MNMNRAWENNRAWETTDQDIVNVMGNHDHDITDERAQEILEKIDITAVEGAALRGDEMEQQTHYAYGEIERQLVALNFLPEDIGYIYQDGV
jgi:sporulation-control protein spo0M